MLDFDANLETEIDEFVSTMLEDPKMRNQKPHRLDYALALQASAYHLIGIPILPEYLARLANFYYNNPSARVFVEQEINYQSLP